MGVSTNPVPEAGPSLRPAHPELTRHYPQLHPHGLVQEATSPDCASSIARRGADEYRLVHHHPSPHEELPPKRTSAVSSPYDILMQPKVECVLMTLAQTRAALPGTNVLPAHLVQPLPAKEASVTGADSQLEVPALPHSSPCLSLSQCGDRPLGKWEDNTSLPLRVSLGKWAGQIHWSSSDESSETTIVACAGDASGSPDHGPLNVAQSVATPAGRGWGYLPAWRSHRSGSTTAQGSCGEHCRSNQKCPYGAGVEAGVVPGWRGLPQPCLCMGVQCGIRQGMRGTSREARKHGNGLWEEDFQAGRGFQGCHTSSDSRWGQLAEGASGGACATSPAAPQTQVHPEVHTWLERHVRMPPVVSIDDSFRLQIEMTGCEACASMMQAGIVEQPTMQASFEPSGAGTAAGVSTPSRGHVSGGEGTSDARRGELLGRVRDGLRGLSVLMQRLDSRGECPRVRVQN
jgi:hypothetical protein